MKGLAVVWQRQALARQRRHHVRCARVVPAMVFDRFFVCIDRKNDVASGLHGAAREPSTATEQVYDAQPAAPRRGWWRNTEELVQAGLMHCACTNITAPGTSYTRYARSSDDLAKFTTCNGPGGRG